MSATALDEDTLDRERKKVALQMIRGGLDSGNLPPMNWLINLDKGTTFCVKDKQDHANYQGLVLTVLNKTDKTVLLVENFTERLFGKVIPDRFERRFELVEVYPPDPEKKEEEDGGVDRVQGDSGEPVGGVGDPAN